MTHKRNALLTGAAAGLIVVATAATAVASIPSASGVISACRTASSGTLRVIDAEAGQTCRSGEVRLDWNVQGPAGPAGPAGPTGPAGPAGPSGVSGYVTVHRTFTVEPNSSRMFEVLCPDGTKPIGGGGHAGNVFDNKGLANISNAYIAESDINDSKNGWGVTAVNTFSQLAEFSADVICISAS